MPVRIIKTDDPLPPGVLFDRMQIRNVQLLQFLRKRIKIVLFKIELKIVSAK